MFDLGNCIRQLHKLGFVHRDIKPKNLLLFDGQLCLSDLGLVRNIADTDEHITEMNEPLGPRAIRSPELQSVEEIDDVDYQKSDVYLYAKTIWMVLNCNNSGYMMKMARMVAYDEGLPVVPNPGILSPQEFVDELFNDRFPNEYLGDTNLRLAVDVSQMVGIRFGETIKAYVAKYGDAARLTAIPLGIAGWLRYMLAVDDEGKRYELAPDPMSEELQEQLKDIIVGKPETFTDQLKPILSNERIFFTDIYQTGLGEKIETMFREMIAGPGAVKSTVHKYVTGR